MFMVKYDETSWRNALGWGKDLERPFSASDATISHELIVEFDEIKNFLNHHVTTGKDYFVYVYGPTGIGKTTVLSWAINAYNGNNKLVIDFISPPTQTEIISRINRVLEPRNLIERVLGGKRRTDSIHNIPELLNSAAKGRKIIFVVDEVEKIANDSEKAKGLNDLKNIMERTHSLTILAGLANAVPHLTDSEGTRLWYNQQIKPMDRGQVIELITKRISTMGNPAKSPFSQEALDEIYSLSQGMPRRALELCNKAIDIAIDDGLEGEGRIDGGTIARAHVELRPIKNEAGISKPAVTEPRKNKPGRVQERMIESTYLGLLTKSEKKLLEYIHAHPVSTAEEIAAGLDSPKTTIWVWIGRVQGNDKERRKEGVPYPLLEESEKDGRKAYSLKNSVSSYYANL